MKSDLGHIWVKLDPGHGSTDCYGLLRSVTVKNFNPLFWIIGGRDDSSVDSNE